MKKAIQKHSEVSLDIIREGIDNLFSGNSLCVISILSGKAIIGESGKYSTYQTGGLKVINPFSAYQCDTEEGTVLLLSIPLSFLKERGIKYCGTILCSASDHTIKGRNKEYDRIRTAFANLWKTTFDEGTNHRQNNLHSKTLELFHLLQNYFASGEGNIFQFGKDPSKKRINTIVEFIRSHWNEELRIGEIADSLKLSPNYLSRFWHEKMGCTMSEYINDIRLEQAKKMLHGTAGITDIALSCGFTDSNSFNRYFKKRFGIMPKQYRSDLLHHKSNSKREHIGDSPDLSTFLSYADVSENKDDLQPEGQTIHIEWNSEGTPLKHTWKKLVNIGFAHDGLMQMVQQQLTQAQQEIGFEFVRFHGIFDEDMHIYNENELGELDPNFIFTDMLLDFLLSINLKPYIEFGYTPKDLAVNLTRELDRETYYSRVNDPVKWYTLVQLFMLHIIGRYGIQQVSSWRFTVAGSELQFQGYLTEKEFLEHYQNTFRAVKSVSETILFGGFCNHSSFILDTDQMENYLKYCKEQHCIPDFISVQNFPIQSIESDALVSPIFLKKISPVTISPNVHYSAQLLQRIESILKKFHLEDKEIWFEEWNCSIWQRDATNDTCFKATWMLMDICENYDRAHAFGYWLLTDFIEERLPRNGAPYFGGFGMFNYHGIPKISWLALQLLQKMGNICLLKGDGYFVTRKESSIQILLYHHALYDSMYRLCNQIPISAGQAYDVFLHRSDRQYHITINNVPGEMVRIKKYILDREHGSSFDKWVSMGQPKNIQVDEINHLKSVAIPNVHIQIKPHKGTLLLETTMHIHECTLYEISFA